MKIKEIISIIKPLSFKETLEYLTERAEKGEGKTFVVTINPEIIMLTVADFEYEKVLKSANLALPDGVGVIWAAKMFGVSYKGRVHGSDLVEKLSEQVSENPITVGFLGGEENVAVEAAKRLKSKYPSLKVAFAIEEWPGSGALRSDAHDNALHGPIINHKSSIINHKMSADILFVAFGSPKQEKWIAQNLEKIDVRVAIGVGGAFDFISGKVPRAPKFVRNLGLEWLFRLIIQPWRAKRQITLIRFVIEVIAERLKSIS